jgi:ABC-type branched-subunit amino acid transport system substrate-binding protein
MRTRVTNPAARLVAVALTAALILAACGSSGSSKSNANKSSSTTAKAVACPGQPVKLMLMTDVTGLQTFPDIPPGAQTAAKAANQTCEAGRPITLEVCNMKADSNAAAACGRKAVSDNALSLVGSVGSTTDSAIEITSKAGIPHFGNSGSSTLEVTDKLSFPNSSSISVYIGSVTAAKAAGAKSYVLMIPDIPAGQILIDTIKRAVDAAGMTWKDPVLIPPDATDMTQVAAQATATKADAIAIAAGGNLVEKVLKAFVDGGLDFTKTDVITHSGILTPDTIRRLGAAIDGTYIVSYNWPIADTSNAGVAQFHKELKAYGGGEATFAKMGAWSGTHALAKIIKGLPTVDRASLVQALQTAKLDRPESAPVNFASPAFPDDPVLKALRIFTREVTIGRVEGGKVVPLTTSFVDVNSPKVAFKKS